jgi:hypothetical protein
VPWCRYCQVKLPAERAAEVEAFGHEPGCPVPDALARAQPDFDALVAEVQRLRS